MGPAACITSVAPKCEDLFLFCGFELGTDIVSILSTVL